MSNIAKRLLILTLLVIMLVYPAMAGVPDTGMKTYISTSDLVVNTPYLDFGLWVLITLLGLFFLVLSNFAKPEQAPKLWAIIAPLFIGPSAYFTLFLRKTSIATYTSTTDIHINAVNVITHPEWLCVVMSIVLVISFVNLWVQLSKQPMEKSKKEEVVGKGEF
jgi:hypothetical protein